MKIKREYPTQTYLKSVLSYNRRTGIFRWRQHVRAPQGGAIAGCDDHGYIGIKIKRVRYGAHRLAWIYVHGSIPAGREVDHRDLKGLSSANTSGFKGVCLSPFGWTAQIQVHRKKIRLGYFQTPELASAAYLAYAKDSFGRFARAI